MEDVWRAHKSRVGKKCSPKKVNKGGCPKVEDYQKRYVIDQVHHLSQNFPLKSSYKLKTL